MQVLINISSHCLEAERTCNITKLKLLQTRQIFQVVELYTDVEAGLPKYLYWTSLNLCHKFECFCPVWFQVFTYKNVVQHPV